MENYSLDQKKAVIMVFGVLVVVLAAINRFFLQNLAMSVAVVALIIVFFLVLIWFLITSRRVSTKAQTKDTKPAKEQKRSRKAK